MKRFRQSIVVAVTAAAIGLLAGCGSQTQEIGQSALPAPVITHTDDAAAPASLQVGDATAPTVTVDTDLDGVLLPPQNVAELGWWVGSARPGSGTGTVVITGHVDDVDQGKGFAARFPDLKPGETVDVMTVNQGVRTYRIDRVEAVNKEGGLPVDELNRLDGPETLALITCGGPFVGPPLGYRDNIVAFGTPV